MSKHPFNQLSNMKCKRCGRLLKLRIVESKPTAELCFRCHVRKEAARNHFVLGKGA